ncbi:MAG: hypothetical protein E6J37_12755 [Chloroflexi bacterium]|nr:MAG: hypothetical protein E6J37_12755 [Chloroflexota bacterium]
MGRFRKRWGGIVQSDDGFTVQMRVSSFPGVRIRYKEGPRTMDVFAEAMAKAKHLVLYQSSMAGWEPPHASETVDDATRQTVLDRIMAALTYAGDVVELEGRFPKVRNHVEGQIQLEQELAAARLKWREEDELRRRWRNDTLEEHRHRDTPR